MTLDALPGPDADVRIEATLCEGFDAGHRMGIWWLPAGEPRGAVLCVQPLGAERSTARHAIASQAWRLAARGWAVLLIDLFGLGDSPGEPAEATLDGWRSDLLRAAMLARRRHSGSNVLWGVRSGALLVADVAMALDQLIDLYVFWQAPASGDAIATIRPEGGSLAPSLLADLRELRMEPPAIAEHGRPPAALFLEVSGLSSMTEEVSVPACNLAEAWLEAGYLAVPRSAAQPTFQAAHATTDGERWPLRSESLMGACIATEEFLEDAQ